jgi:outer membrane protein insertion porin family
MGERVKRLVSHIVGGCLFAVLLLAPGAKAVAQEGGALSGGIVGEIVVEGAQRIEPETVRSYLLVRKGDNFNQGRIDRSLKSLFATGLFADVSMERQGDTLVVSVIENPVINRIAFEGNQEIDDDILSSEVSLRPRIIYTRTKVQSDVKRILTLYRFSGRFAATVEPKVIQLEQNRVDLVFEVDEGDLTEIRKIRVIGNKEFDDSRLREVIRTKESRWYRFFSSDDTYDPDRLTLDRELLRRFYLSNGYADFRVVSALAELTPNRENFFITFTIEEGARFQFGNVDVAVTLRGLEKEDMDDVVEIEQGEWYDSNEVEEAIDELTNEAGILGYAFVNVRPRINRDRDTKTIDVTFDINEGPRVYVEKINIIGNVRTVDKVIRREFRLVEGDAFNAAKLRRSRERLQNLDFFEKVMVEEVPGSAPDKTVIQVEVEEKSTGSLSLGLGYSTSSGPMGELSVDERNLMGRGQDLSLKLVIAASKSQINLAFTEPFFIGREVAMGFDAFRTTSDNQNTSSFDTETIGGAVRMGYPVTEFVGQTWRYSLKQEKLSNVPDTGSRFVVAEEGTTFLSELTHAISYADLDNRMSPTKGHAVSFATTFAGIGGNTNFLHNSLKGGQYFPLMDQVVLSLTGQASHIFGISQDVRLLDRFFLGGDTLRGFSSSGVGPRDSSTGDSLGGQWMYRASLQTKFPLGLPPELGISGRVFTDMGSLGEIDGADSTVQDTGSLRASAGLGVLWDSPFGPVGIDYAYPFLKEDFDKEEVVRVNFGSRF